MRPGTHPSILAAAALVALTALTAGAAGSARTPSTSTSTPNAQRPRPNAQRPTPNARVDFSKDVLPVLSIKCYACHGPDPEARAVNLRLDLRGEALKARPRGAAIVPGKLAASRVWVRISQADPARRMPPPKSGHSLTPDEVRLIRRWIEQGAPYAEHWAFKKPVRPPLPRVRTAGWARNPIDLFVLARLEKAGLKPSPEADRYTLIRRVSLDLTGLPPTPAEVEAFVRESSSSSSSSSPSSADRGRGRGRAEPPHPTPDLAYERLVDRLLASPAYGERWARLWLDLARYADSAGYGSDPLRMNIWPYRDWVIDAFNRNLPYDRFTVEQIAGDLLADEDGKGRSAKEPQPAAASPESPISTISSREARLLATAFHRNTMTNTEGGTDDEEWRVAAVKDRIATTSQVWMGLTMGCAQCHTHKFDPITQKEYYQFFGLFNGTEDADRPDEKPTLPVPTPAQQAKLEGVKQEVAALEAKIAALPAMSPELAPLKTSLEAKKKELAANAPVEVPIMRELPADKPRVTRVMLKGNFLNPGDTVEPGLPAAFPPLPAGAPRNRLGAALWLVSPENPLTARVAVNRFWAQLFGAGIVETEEDFGTQGALPTHPELLDWLAVSFAEGSGFRVQGSGSEPPNAERQMLKAVRPEPRTPNPEPWNTKALLRALVTSATYRQSARVTPALLAKDPRDRLLGRFPRRRLEAETVRDQALALSGLLSRKIGGPSVYPPQPDGLWRAAFNGQRTWPTSTGEDRYRRGLYTFWRRTVPYPSMATFDAPSREICTVRRIPTNTPLQALVTLNDPAYVEMAQALGRRLLREGGATVPDRARFGLRLALSRPPSEEQVRTVVSLYERELARYRADAEGAKKLAADPLGPIPAGMDAAEAAAWTVVANVLLNLDGVLTKG